MSQPISSRNGTVSLTKMQEILREIDNLKEQKIVLIQQTEKVDSTLERLQSVYNKVMRECVLNGIFPES